MKANRTEAKRAGDLEHRHDPTDEALMRAYVADDQRAFRVLFERYAPLIVGIARRGGLSEEDAGDLAQQSFLQLHRARHDFRPGAALRPWLLTIAYNLKRDHLRRRRRWLFAAQPAEDIVAVAPGQAVALEQREQRKRVQQALGQLPANQREVIDLHWYADVPFAEIATTIGVKVGTVKVRAHRGYQKLRALLADARRVTATEVKRKDRVT